MTTRSAEQTRRPIPLVFWPLLLLTLVGVALAVYRLAVGLGPTTNMSDDYPWGIWITIDIFVIPAAGAAFTTALITYFLHRQRYHEIIRPAILIGLLGYSVVGLLLIMDIGRWHQAYNVFVPPYINIHSFLWEIALCVTLYTLVLVAENAPTYLERWNLHSPIRIVTMGILAIAGAGIVLSTLHQSSIGSMFLIMEHKLHPLWWTPALPLFYFVQAVFGGLATAVVVTYVTWAGLDLTIDETLVVRIGKVLRVMLLVYLGLRAVDTLAAGELDMMFSSGMFSLLVWAEIIIGVVAPLVILFSNYAKSAEGVFIAGVFILTGLLLDRLVISGLGLAVPTADTYVPHWMEVMISVGFISGALLVYGATTRYFDLFPREH
jgi:Ni/Fe-hydrogenase subunit HybB-like protein